MEAIDLLHQVVQSQEPKTIVCCGHTACRIADSWAENHPGVRVCKLATEAPDARFPLAEVYDLALVSDTLEHLPRAEGKTLLGQLRNAGARRIAVLVETDSGWRFGDFIALGFKHAGYCEGSPSKALYTYDIANYNYKRQWNNPDHWANPEMWNKARW